MKAAIELRCKRRGVGHLARVRHFRPSIVPAASQRRFQAVDAAGWIGVWTPALTADLFVHVYVAFGRSRAMVRKYVFSCSVFLSGEQAGQYDEH